MLPPLWYSMPPNLAEFMSKDFKGEVRKALSHIKLSSEEKTRIERNTFGTILKLLYALVWQEEALFSNPIITEPLINRVSDDKRPELLARKLEQTHPHPHHDLEPAASLCI